MLSRASSVLDHSVALGLSLFLIFRASHCRANFSTCQGEESFGFWFWGLMEGLALGWDVEKMAQSQGNYNHGWFIFEKMFTWNSLPQLSKPYSCLPKPHPLTETVVAQDPAKMLTIAWTHLGASHHSMSLRGFQPPPLEWPCNFSPVLFPGVTQECFAQVKPSPLPFNSVWFG